MAKKMRLDALVHQLHPQYSRRQIQSWIMQRKVKVDDQIVDKSGAQVRPDVQIALSVEKPKFVSRAGFKLEKALDHFAIDVTDLSILDAGLSTGGFTDCLLKRGAREVFGIDVGHAQVHEQIQRDPRVHVFEKTNLRYVTPETIGTTVDMVTLDLSFISIVKVLDAVNSVLKPGGRLITLIKPQFEAEKHQVAKGGIVKDEAVHTSVVEKVTQAVIDRGYSLEGVIPSPIFGSAGNKEFLAVFKKNRQPV